MNLKKHMNRPYLFFALSLSLLSESALHSLQFPGPDVPALLRVNSVRRTSFGQFFQQDQRQVLISRGGGVMNLVAADGPSGALFYIRAFRGLGTQQELATLGQALVEARVGMQSDCTLGSMNAGHIEVTWYGRNGRQNTFRVALQEEAPPSQRCPDSVFFLVEAIDRFIDDAVSGFPQD